MRFATSLTLLTVALASQVAHAGAALDEEKKAPATGEPSTAPDSPQEAPAKVEYGVDIRLRQVYVPKGMIQLFVARAAGGASNGGLGLDLVRRRGNLELQLGFEFEHITPGEGVWINKGDNVANGDEADYVLNPEHAGSKLGWFSIEFTFLNHAVINKYLAVRYGGGAGLGVITGALKHYNVICNGATNSSPEPGCVPNGGGFSGLGTDSDGQNFSTPVSYGLPPVFPVVNAIIGLQIRPTPKAVINLEGGIRTIPFFGMSAGYFF